MTKKKIRDGHLVRFYHTQEINNQTKYLNSRIVVNNIKPKLRGYIEDEFEYSDNNELFKKIEQWDGKTKLVLDSDINEEARNPIDNEPWGEGIPYYRIIVDPVQVEEIRTLRIHRSTTQQDATHHKNDD